MRANSVGKSYSEVDLAYVAGLIDGDGAVMACIEPHNEKKFRFRVRVVLKVTQKYKKDLVFLTTTTISFTITRISHSIDNLNTDF